MLLFTSGCGRARTCDRWLKRPLLYQLSYTPKIFNYRPLTKALHTQKEGNRRYCTQYPLLSQPHLLYCYHVFSYVWTQNLWDSDAPVSLLMILQYSYQDTRHRQGCIVEHIDIFTFPGSIFVLDLKTT